MARRLTNNARKILRVLIASRGGLDRLAIAEHARLSRPTVKTAVDELIRAGLAEEIELRERTRAGETAHNSNGKQPAERDEPPRGRPPKIVRLTTALGASATIDLGHGHMSVAILDANCRILAMRPRRLLDPTKRPSEPDDPRHPKETSDGKNAFNGVVDVDLEGPRVLRCAARLIEECLSECHIPAAQLRGVALGVPAPLHNGTVAVPSFLRSWAEVSIPHALGRALREQMHEELPEQLQLVVENDAGLCVLGEIASRRNEELRDVVLAKVSSGIGAGLYQDGKLRRGIHGSAGELGHLTVPSTWNRGNSAPTHRYSAQLEEVCDRCGKPNCLEQMASGSAILREVEVLPAPDGEIDHLPTDLDEIIRRARERTFDPRYRTAIVDASLRLGAVLGEVATLLDPQLIVIAGTLAHAGDLVSRSVAETLQTHAMLYDVNVETVPSERQPLIALIGGGTLVWDQLPEAVPGTTPAGQEPAPPNAKPEPVLAPTP
jgi:predicted NBD/HSP70 family sugar kinase